MTYEEHKRQKLKRMWQLRLMDWLGMVSWRKTQYNGARQYLRRLHPLVWVWALASWVIYSLAYGFLGTSKDLKSVWTEETVWW